MVRYKTIENERLQDAPFVGGLVSSIGCSINCKGCFNQHLKKLPTKTKSAKDIVAEVMNCTYNKGIILAGLEWSEQPTEMIDLVLEAQANALEVCIYTGKVKDVFLRMFPKLHNYYLKSGSFNEETKGEFNTSLGIHLANKTQEIEFIT